MKDRAKIIRRLIILGVVLTWVAAAIKLGWMIHQDLQTPDPVPVPLEY